MKKTFAFGVLVSNKEIIAAHKQGRLPHPKLGIVESAVAGLSFVYHKDSEDFNPTVSVSVTDNCSLTASILYCPKEQEELLCRTFPSATDVLRRQINPAAASQSAS